MIALIDNYDSFVHNLARYFQRMGHDTQVFRNTAIDAPSLADLHPAAIVLSPGPCGPAEAGSSLELVRQLHTRMPILGVCLGHQIIAAAFGAKVIRGTPMHGQASPVLHDGQRLFAGLPSPLAGGRYHSLVVDETSLPDLLQVTARSDDGTIMALAHRQLPVFGVQFHPESILTEHGYALLANFLALAGLKRPETLPPSELYGGHSRW